ncbi:MAG TPA: glycosyltransferase, partial [Puia sp.]|nr:glycosyltransferase [Puia sp.]
MAELEIETELFAAQNFFFSYYNKSLINKIFFRLGISSIYKKINELLFKKAKQYKPDVVWIFKGMEVFPKTIDQLKLNGCKVVNYNPDNPFIFSGRGSGNENVKDSIGKYDLHFVYDKAVQKKIAEEYSIKTAYLPFGFDLDESLYNECILQPEIVKVCFLGNPDNERAAFLKKLLDNGNAIDIYGNDWNKFINHPNASLFPPVYGNELWKILRRYRVQLNLMRIHNINSHNMRSFEIPAVGGIMIAPDTPEHKMFFENEKEIFLFKNLNECVEKIHHVLNLTADDANQI